MRQFDICQIYFQKMSYYIAILTVATGHWGPWGSYSMCTYTCGAGTKARSRTCIAGRHESVICNGEDQQRVSCNTDPCPGNSYDVSQEHFICLI